MPQEMLLASIRALLLINMVLCASCTAKKDLSKGEGTEKDVSLSGSHFKRLERTPSDEDKSYPRYETLDPMNSKSHQKSLKNTDVLIAEFRDAKDDEV